MVRQMKEKKKENKKTAKEEAELLLKDLEIEGKVEVEEEEDGIRIVIDAGENNAFLIGRHGDTLSSLQHILTLIVTKKAGEFVRLIVEIGDYRKQREEYLRNLAEKLKQEVVSNSIERTIRDLKSWERRIVHVFLTNDPDVVTESRGEGRERILVIKKK